MESNLDQRLFQVSITKSGHKAQDVYKKGGSGSEDDKYGELGVHSHGGACL